MSIAWFEFLLRVLLLASITIIAERQMRIDHPPRRN